MYIKGLFQNYIRFCAKDKTYLTDFVFCSRSILVWIFWFIKNITIIKPEILVSAAICVFLVVSVEQM